MKVSEATLVWELWRQRKRTRRTWISWGASLGVALSVLALSAWGFLPLFAVGEKGEAVAVKLGNPEGEDLPIAVSAQPDRAMQAVLAAQKAVTPQRVEETRPSAADAVPAPKAPPAATPAPNRASQPAATAAPTVTEKVIRGVEKGNASELVLKPQGEKISQNAYWPVYLFMPLPSKLPADLLARVKGNELYSAQERRALLLQVYSREGDLLTLTSDPGLPTRPALWEILEGAGYDVANAEYKRGKALKAVVLSFRLDIPHGSDNPSLLDVKVEQGSGNGQVDEAVLYAFKRSTFANGTGQIAQGRYTYDFSARK